MGIREISEGDGDYARLRTQIVAKDKALREIERVADDISIKWITKLRILKDIALSAITPSRKREVEFEHENTDKLAKTCLVLLAAEAGATFKDPTNAKGIIASCILGAVREAAVSLDSQQKSY